MPPMGIMGALQGREAIVRGLGGLASRCRGLPCPLVISNMNAALWLLSAVAITPTSGRRYRELWWRSSLAWRRLAGC